MTDPTPGLAEAAERARASHASALRHDLRSPVNAMVGFIELLGDPRTGQLTDRQRRYLDNAISASADLLGLIDELSELYRVDPFEAPRWEPIDLRSAVATALAATSAAAEAKSIRIGPPAAGGPLVVRGDRRMLGLACYHLVRSAIRSAESGGALSVKLAGSEGRVSLELTVPTGSADRDGEAAAALSDAEPPSLSGRQAQALVLARRLVELHGGTTRGRLDLVGTLNLGFELPAHG